MSNTKWKNYENEIKSITNRFGQNINFLGSGIEGATWSIDNRYTIKLFNHHHSLKKYELEKNIYEKGVISNNIFWIIKDYLYSIDNEDSDFFEILIIEIINSIDKNLKKTLKESRIAKKSYKYFINNAQIDFKVLDLIRQKYSLETNWLYIFILEIVCKMKKNEDIDIHYNNLGINYITKTISLFDW